MTKTQFENLQLNDKVVSTKKPDLVLNVVEICEEEKSISKWIVRGHDANMKRIVKLQADYVPDGHTFYTWAGQWDNWDLIEVK